MGPIFGNFISWWQLLTLIIGQSDKMLTELKKVNEAESYLLHQWTLWSVVINIKFLTLCFHSVCQVLAQGTRYSNVTASLLPQPTLLGEATITCRLVITLLNAAFRHSVPSQILFSITCGLVASY